MTEVSLDRFTIWFRKENRSRLSRISKNSSSNVVNFGPENHRRSKVHRCVKYNMPDSRIFKEHVVLSFEEISEIHFHRFCRIQNSSLSGGDKVKNNVTLKKVHNIVRYLNIPQNISWFSTQAYIIHWTGILTVWLTLSTKVVSVL